MAPWSVAEQRRFVETAAASKSRLLIVPVGFRKAFARWPPRGSEMSKKPKIEHEYHAGKGKLKITISGYALSKKLAVKL